MKKIEKQNMINILEEVYIELKANIRAYQSKTTIGKVHCLLNELKNLPSPFSQCNVIYLD